VAATALCGANALMLALTGEASMLLLRLRRLPFAPGDRARDDGR
jgi:hypothetical protein